MFPIGGVQTVFLLCNKNDIVLELIKIEIGNDTSF